MGTHRHKGRFDWKVAILALVAIVLAYTSVRAAQAPISDEPFAWGTG